MGVEGGGTVLSWLTECLSAGEELLRNQAAESEEDCRSEDLHMPLPLN